MKKAMVVAVMAAGLMLGGCAPFLGGATYEYQATDQNTGKTVNLKVKTNREVKDALRFEMDPETGKVKVVTGGINSGPDNMQAVIDALVKALMAASQAGAVAVK